MDKRQFRRILHEITEQEIPDDMNRWNEIKAKAQKAQLPARPSRPVRMSMRAVFIFILLFVSAAGGYAYYQQIFPFPPRGMEGASDAGLLTMINYSQTIEGVTVIVRWAYADESRVVVCTETAVDGSSEIFELDRIARRARLYEMHGTLVDRPQSGSMDEDRCQMEFSFSLPTDTEIPDPMNLTFELVYLGRPRAASIFEKIFVGNYVANGPETFGAPIVPTLSPEVTREPMPAPDQGVGPFIFNFNLSRLSGVTLSPQQTITAAGIPITLRTLTFAPSKTSMELCIDAPGFEGGWMPDIQLTAGEIFTDMGGGETHGYKGTPSICYKLDFDIFIGEQPDKLTITVTALETNEIYFPDHEAERQALWDRANELGANISPDGSSSSLDDRIYMNQAKVELGYRIEGPWTFEVDLP